MQKPNSFRKLVNITSTDQVSERRNEAILKEDIALQRQTKDGMIPTHQKFTRPHVDKLKYPSIWKGGAERPYAMNLEYFTRFTRETLKIKFDQVKEGSAQQGEPEEQRVRARVQLS